MDKIRDHTDIFVSIPNDGNCDDCLFCLRQHDYDRIWTYECLRFFELLNLSIVDDTKIIIAPSSKCENGKYRG